MRWLKDESNHFFIIYNAIICAFHFWLLIRAFIDNFVCDQVEMNQNQV